MIDTTTQQAFLRTISESPEDDAPKLVFADWLDERDDPAGSCMRLAVRKRWSPGAGAVSGWVMHDWLSESYNRNNFGSWLPAWLYVHLPGMAKNTIRHPDGKRYPAVAHWFDSPLAAWSALLDAYRAAVAAGHAQQ